MYYPSVSVPVKTKITNGESRLSAGGSGATKRKPWDFKGKVSDMEVKMRNYQTKVKSVNEENDALKSTMVQNQTRAAEMQKELERQRAQIGYPDQRSCSINLSSF